MRKLTLLIDCDEVLRDFIGKALEVYNKKNKTKYTYNDMKEWKLAYNIPGFDEKVFFQENSEEVFLNAEPHKYAKEVMKLLCKKYNVIIVTAQYKENEQFTLDWLKKHKIPYHNIYFGKDKNSVVGDIILDDKIGNLKKCIDSKICVCRSHKWNKDWKGLKVKDLKEFELLLKRFEKND